MSKDKHHIPKASTLMGSLRSMGYSFEASIADIIDNSISAHASNVHILFPLNPLDTMAVGILDDGDGMDKEYLFEAMRYGSSASEDERAEDDLGRFGMGLKSASLSQCRILTVVSYDGSELNAYTWDYSYILEKQDWIIKELNHTEIDQLPYIESLKKQCKGTLVIWEDFDVLHKSSGGQIFETLNDLRSVVEEAVALIFHRYLSSTGKDQLKIYINNLLVSPLDPFLENHPKTTYKKEKTIAICDSNGVERLIYIKPYVLPFATDLKDKDKKLIGGIDNLRSKQGFYIYRNKRLIIWGTWFGMNKRAELTKNARIRVDIPNTLDDIWSIDIMKQKASIPKRILNQLKKTVMEALDISVRQQNYRGRSHNVDSNIDYIWDRKEGRNNMFYYEINRNSKLFKFVRDHISDDDYIYLDMLVTEIERNIPTHQMYLDKSNEAIYVEEDRSRIEDVIQIGISMGTMLLKLRNDAVETIVDELMKSEPFCHYPSIKNQLINALGHE